MCPLSKGDLPARLWHSGGEGYLNNEAPYQMGISSRISVFSSSLCEALPRFTKVK